MVDAMTYLLNYLAEKWKHPDNLTTKCNQRRFEGCQLLLEILPPLFSVIVLLIVTIFAMINAFQELLFLRDDTTAITTAVQGKTTITTPNLNMMFLISFLNLLVDCLNLNYFSRVHYQGLAGSPRTTELCKAVDSRKNDNESTSFLKQQKRRRKDELTSEVFMYSSLTTLHTSGTTITEDEEAVSSLRFDNNDHTTPKTIETRALTGGTNLNMCSAWTHIFADTLRSIAVLLAAASSTWFFPQTISPVVADCGATIAVSIIIFITLLPLIHGLTTKMRQISTI